MHIEYPDDNEFESFEYSALCSVERSMRVRHAFDNREGSDNGRQENPSDTVDIESRVSLFWLSASNNATKLRLMGYWARRLRNGKNLACSPGLVDKIKLIAIYDAFEI